MRSKKLLKMLNKAITNEHLYTKDEMEYMKTQFNFIKENILKKEAKNYKGFGGKYETKS